MHKHHAFTLFEMLVSLTIIVILTACAVSAWRDFSRQAHHELVREQLIWLLQDARQEAQARHVPIAVCSMDEEKRCQEQWTGRVMAFIDEMHDGVVHRFADIIAVREWAMRGGRIHWRSYPHYRHYLQFLPQELIISDNATFWYCDTQTDKPVWAVMISKTGLMHTERQDKDGQIKDSHGKMLRCDAV